MRKPIIPTFSSPSIILLDPRPDGDGQAALVLPGRMPKVYPDLSAAMAALREVSA